jgi:hypothetical protein
MPTIADRTSERWVTCLERVRWREKTTHGFVMDECPATIAAAAAQRARRSMLEVPHSPSVPLGRPT